MNRREKDCVYDLIPWEIGEVGLVRNTHGGHDLIRRILLPHEGRSTTERIMADFPEATLRTGNPDELCVRLRDFLTGKSAAFVLEMLDFGVVHGFAQRVLRMCARIPRGRVTTYGRLAARVGVPGGARAVGNVMADNPFPLVIPCHRVVRSDGSLGGFGGGSLIKRRLLEMEGVRLEERERILPGYIL